MFKSGRLHKDLKNPGPMPVFHFDGELLEALAEGRLVVAELPGGAMDVSTLRNPREEHWFLGLPADGAAGFGSEAFGFDELVAALQGGVLFRARLTDDRARVQIKSQRPAVELFEHLCAAAERAFHPAYSVKLKRESELPSMMELAVTLPFSKESVAQTHRAPDGSESSFAWIRRKGPKISLPLWFWRRGAQWTAYSECGTVLPP